MKELVFATQNKGKLKEIKSILAPITVLSMAEVGFNGDIEENGKTFEENARIKALAIGQLTGKIVLADDSGLEIDYLDKAPGVYSARYLGEDTPYEVKNAKILQLLQDVPWEQRSARFVCAICAAFPDGNTAMSRGVMEGYIAYRADGENGFGYDPVFYVAEYKMTSAKMAPDQKNKISHRAQALLKMKEILAQYEYTGHQ